MPIFVFLVLAFLSACNSNSSSDESGGDSSNQNESPISANNKVADDSTPSGAASNSCSDQNTNPYQKSAWTKGPPKAADYFPISVWLQSPHNAANYKAIGINTYIAFYGNPTDQDLNTLKNAGMSIMVHQTPVTLAHKNDTLSNGDSLINGWFAEPDEPDNAQSDGNGGYGPPVDPLITQAHYANMKAVDSTRPVFLSLGQGVAWDGWYGRGVRTNHPEDYAHYLQGTDIGTFDIYPFNSNDAAVANQIGYVPQGVNRMLQSKPNGINWTDIECTNMDGTDGSPGPTPAQVKAEVWLALTHGSQGIMYFAHIFAPTFIEAGLLSDATMRNAVSAINLQIKNLAPVLNSPTLTGVSVESSNSSMTSDTMVKRYQGYLYVFSVNRGNTSTQGTFKISGLNTSGVSVEVLGENRTLSLANNQFQDSFSPYGVHLYKIPSPCNGVGGL